MYCTDLQLYRTTYNKDKPHFLRGYVPLTNYKKVSGLLTNEKRVSGPLTNQRPALYLLILVEGSERVLEDGLRVRLAGPLPKHCKKKLDLESIGSSFGFQ